MSIAVDEVGVLATIMPVALLLVGFEVRAFPSLVATDKIGTVMLWCLGGLMTLALAMGFLAEWRMVQALLDGVGLTGGDVVLVRVGFWLIGMVSFWLLAGTLLFKLGVLQRLGGRAWQRTKTSPRRLSRQIDYVDKHHPNWRNPEQS
jgi:hypothetical protein